jgi:hypothetical protein
MDFHTVGAMHAAADCKATTQACLSNMGNFDYLGSVVGMFVSWKLDICTLLTCLLSTLAPSIADWIFFHPAYGCLVCTGKAVKSAIANGPNGKSQDT